eukprot:9600679-Alexandrium_andersonii.AAC.1
MVSSPSLRMLGTNCSRGPGPVEADRHPTGISGLGHLKGLRRVDVVADHAAVALGCANVQLIVLPRHEEASLR